MTVHFNVLGKKRKELATEIALWLGEEVHYCGAPSFAYKIDYFTIDKNGNLSFSDLADSEVVERLLEHLHDYGFEMDLSAETELEAPIGTSIQIPLSHVDVGKLTKILDVKGSLIKKAFDTEDLSFSIMEDRVDLPWFKADSTPKELNAYMHFITALCEMTKNQTRIIAKEKTVDNEKYAFRCFLLRLGFIGDEYKAERKILLRNLSGSSAFKTEVEK